MCWSGSDVWKACLLPGMAGFVCPVQPGDLRIGQPMAKTVVAADVSVCTIGSHPSGSESRGQTHAVHSAAHTACAKAKHWNIMAGRLPKIHCAGRGAMITFGHSCKRRRSSWKTVWSDAL